jgi:hypothetical protein
LNHSLEIGQNVISWRTIIQSVQISLLRAPKSIGSFHSSNPAHLSVSPAAKASRFGLLLQSS